MGLPSFLFDNRFLDGTPTATDTAAGCDVQNITDLRTFTFWQGTGPGTDYLTVDCGASKSADSLGIIGHNLNTCGATVSIESSSTGAWAGEQTTRLAGFTPTNDKALFKKFSSASDRYWRLKIVTAAIAPRIAVCLLGLRLEMPYPPDAPYLPYSEGIIGLSERSKTGNLLGAIVRYYPITIAPCFSNLSSTFVFNNFQAFWDGYAKLLKPFIYVWEPDAFPQHVFLVSVDESQQTNLFETPIQYQGLVDRIQMYLIGVKEI